MAFATAGWARFTAVVLFSGGCRNFIGNNTRWNSDDSVTNQHDDTGNEFAHWRNRGDIPIAYRCDGNNSLVNTFRNAGKPILMIFNQIHHRAQNRYQHDNGKHENADFLQTGPDGHA